MTRDDKTLEEMECCKKRLKQCTQCGEEKPLSEFHRLASAPDGLNYRCKMCVHKHNKMYFEANRERICAQHKEWNQENPELVRCRSRAAALRRRVLHREKYIAYGRCYRKNNRERIYQRTKAYRGAHPEQPRQWREQNREKSRSYCRKRRALVQGFEEHFTGNMVEFVHTFQKDKCTICKREEPEIKLCIDHWRPLSRGYILTMKNAVLMCVWCNTRKSDKLPSEVFGSRVVRHVEQMLSQQDRTWTREFAEPMFEERRGELRKKGLLKDAKD